MELNKIYLAMIASSALAMTGCGSDSDSDSDSGSNKTACSVGVGTVSDDVYFVNGAATGTPVCDLTGTIAQDVTLTTDYVYRLNNYVYVGNGNAELDSAAEASSYTMTVEAGVQFRSSGPGSLVITRGSDLNVEGTAAAPVVMAAYELNTAADNAETFEDSGRWGGLVLQGFAGNNQCENDTTVFCNTDDEAGTGFHGGETDSDSSGDIQYLIVAEGGYEVAADSEVNGITLHSVGYGTNLENIMVFHNADDGIEFFGGSASVKNMILVDNEDESIDWDDGYNGNIQFALVRQGITATGDHGIEADTRGISTDAQRDSQPVLTNITFQVGNDGSDDLFRFKEGTNGNLSKIAADGYGDAFLVEDADTNVTVSDVLIEFSGAATTYNDNNTNANLTGWSDASTSTTVTLGSMFEVTSAGAAVTASTATAVNGQGNFFEETDYIGAVDPDAATAWWAWADAIMPAAFDASPANVAEVR